MGVIATTNTQHYQDIANSVRYSKDGTAYVSDLAAARAEIAEDNGYFADISAAVQGKTGQVAPYDKDELAQAINGIDTFTFPIDGNSEVSVLVPGISQDGFYLSSNPNDKTAVSFGVDENNNLYVMGGIIANA